MERPSSISIKDLNKLVPKAVTSALNRQRLKSIKAAPTFFPGHGIVGFVVRDLAGQPFDAAAAHSLSSDIAGTIGQGSVPATLMLGPDIVVGFFPADRI
ncbi:hypothetical protein NKJ95_23810 [Mesorhizobium sp. M0012]|uniref:hypothetical protein n=1 Tax=Mesorhizobium sp. M0012 TaxID=2956840 RepID=UPI00333B8630